MIGLIIILSIIFWYANGICAFYFWWLRTEDEITLLVMIMSVFIGLGGIFNWLLGWLIHGNADEITIFKRKK